jgi:hypothetical protein
VYLTPWCFRIGYTALQTIVCSTDALTMTAVTVARAHLHVPVVLHHGQRLIIAFHLRQSPARPSMPPSRPPAPNRYEFRRETELQLWDPSLPRCPATVSNSSLAPPRARRVPNSPADIPKSDGTLSDPRDLRHAFGNTLSSGDTGTLMTIRCSPG